MKQAYHTNATTNVHTRALINKSTLSNVKLADQHHVSLPTVQKWKNRDCWQDKSSRPNAIEYALSEVEMALAISVRKSTWFSLAEVHEALLVQNKNISKSAVYRLWRRESINVVPQPQKEKAKKFKEYDPGFLHMDVTYMPKLNGQAWYLFVAIDRATRMMFYKLYPAKSAMHTEQFTNECILFFPFEISHILTDNGLEFTNHLIRSKKGTLCKKPSKLDEICTKERIEHRLTKPFTPQTNGMVERVNGTIKSNTILKSTYNDVKEMNEDLINFLVYYILHRRHGSLRKELKVKTPFQAIEKWYQLKPQLFHHSPDEFKLRVLNLKTNNSCFS